MNDENRNIIMKFRVNESEADYIENKFRLSGCKSRSRFIRLMLIEGAVLHFDREKEKKLLVESSRISSNINQIARRINADGNIYKEDLENIMKGVDELSQQLKYFQSLLRKLKP